MMHYRKGDNVEKEITKEQLPFEDCMPTPQAAQGGAKGDFLWMQVKGGTKLPNVISYAKNALDGGECRTVVWSGSGGGVIKTISCAEILKRSYPLYQVTRMCYHTVEEHWKPQMDGLEDIVAQRQIPCLHILMSLDAIDDSISGLQKPNTTTDFWQHQDANPSNNSAGAGGGRHGGPTRSGGNGQKQQQQQRQQQRPPKQRPQQQQHDQQKQQQQTDAPTPNRNQKRTRRPNKLKTQQEEGAGAASLTTTESMET